MTRLILIRHGETDWNVEGRYQGQSDVSLNDRGRREFASLAATVAESNPSVIYSSDLSRAKESAEIIGRVLGLSVCVDSRLREIHLGSWEGMLFQEIQEIYSDLLERRKLDPHNVRAPGGETISEVESRVVASVKDILNRHPDETVVIVSHGLPLAILRARYQGLPIEQVWELVPKNNTLFFLTL